MSGVKFILLCTFITLSNTEVRFKFIWNYSSFEIKIFSRMFPKPPPMKTTVQSKQDPKPQHCLINGWSWVSMSLLSRNMCLTCLQEISMIEPPLSALMECKFHTSWNFVAHFDLVLICYSFSAYFDSDSFAAHLFLMSIVFFYVFISLAKKQLSKI